MAMLHHFAVLLLLMQIKHTVSAESYEYLGCYEDKQSFDNTYFVAAGSHMSTEVCGGTCKKHQLPYFGILFGRYCYCGEFYGSFNNFTDKASEAYMCHSRCVGNANEKCGGSSAKSVYATGLPKRPYSRIGCYRDKSTRNNSPKSPKLIFKKMTVAKCYKKCGELIHTYFSLQDAEQCNCGENLSELIKTDLTNCMIPCTYDKYGYCGGLINHKILYTIDYYFAKYKYVGCYEDRITRGYFIRNVSEAGNMSSQICGAECRKQKFIYFGLKSGSRCFCGNFYSSSDNVDAYISNSSCNIPCSGNASEMCGGDRANSVYETGYQINYKYLGCYRDTNKRDLPINIGPSRMTKEKCGDACRRRNFTYFGLQARRNCFCGDFYGRYGNLTASSDTSCNMKCTGNDSQYCGGNWGNSIYETGLLTIRSYKYLGLYWESDIRRDLTTYIGSGVMSKEICGHACTKRKFPYFGLRDGVHCSCSDFYGAYGNLAGNKEPRFNKKCSGNASQVCGGNWVNSVYATGLSIKKPYLRIGCFKDSSSLRDLKVAIGGGYSFVACYRTCFNRGFRFAGIQAGHWCYCDDSYGKYSKASFYECNTRCKYGLKRYCGGNLRNEIYQVRNISW